MARTKLEKRVVMTLEPEETFWCRHRKNDDFLVMGLVFLPSYFERGRIRVLDENGVRLGTNHGRPEYMDLRDIPEALVARAKEELGLE